MQGAREGAGMSTLPRPCNQLPLTLIMSSKRKGYLRTQGEASVLSDYRVPYRDLTHPRVAVLITTNKVPTRILITSTAATSGWVGPRATKREKAPSIDPRPLSFLAQPVDNLRAARCPSKMLTMLFTKATLKMMNCTPFKIMPKPAETFNEELI